MSSGRRQGDRGWRRLVRENAYRDVWLFAVTVLVLFAVIRSMDTANQAKGTVAAIQANRLELIGGNCTDQNRHNRRTKKKLNELIGELPRRERVQAQASKGFTVALIDALAPPQDCKALVRRAAQLR